MTDKEPPRIPQNAEQVRSLIGEEAEVLVAILQPALNLMADRWANDPPELQRVKKMAQVAALAGMAEWMTDEMRAAGADRETLSALVRMTAAMRESFTRSAAAQREAIEAERASRIRIVPTPVGEPGP